MTQMNVEQLLREIKSGMKALYGARLRGVYLYGSSARREQEPESDLDVLIVLENDPRYSAEIERTGQRLSDSSCKGFAGGR